MRKFIVAANWKMNKNIVEALDFLEDLENLLGKEGVKNREIIIFPSFLALPEMSKVLKGSFLKLGAQNVYCEKNGAFTGEVAPPMVKEVAEYVLIGHSDRRHIFGENDELLNKKVKAVLADGLRPILCVGETAEEREAGSVSAVLSDQITKDLNGIAATKMEEMIIVYEPVWAISRGESKTKPATIDDIIKAHKTIRDILAKLYGGSVADSITIQYGGSIKPENAKEIFSLPEVDGGLVGGASLDPVQFAEIIKAAS